jgi:hypothetical protein
MKPNSIARLLALVAATQLGLACSRFVWHEDPFTPDQAPASETLVSGRATTYVLKGSSYYLLAGQRAQLWHHDVMDDVAWRYNALFGDAPPMIAIRIDSIATPNDSVTWRGVPFATVAVHRRPDAGPARKNSSHDKDAQANDSARVQMLTGPMLAATAAETWLKARTLDAARSSDSQPGGPIRSTSGSAALPAWIEAAALRILGSAGAPDRAAAELGAEPKNIAPLATLFATTWPSRPNAMDIVHPGFSRMEMGGEDVPQDAAARARNRREVAPGVSPVLIAQSVSVLTFIHDREPALVPRLADELVRGTPISQVLASSSKLPHDLAALDAAWRDWLRHVQRAK